MKDLEGIPDRTTDLCGDAGLQTRAAPDRGPVRILCDEIGFAWDPRLERTDLLVGFVRGLVAEVAMQCDFSGQIAHLTGKPPSEGALSVLRLAQGMLSVTEPSALIGGAKMVHAACDRFNPEDRYPTDHVIDMVSSCASAILFGLESPCHSRHAAEASNHVWKQLYSVSRFDSHTPDWSNAWARSCLQNAIISLLPDAARSASPLLTAEEGPGCKPPTSS